MIPSDPKSKPAVPLGRPLKHTDDELEQLAEITPADMEAARVFWRKHAPKRFKALLDAEPADGRTTSANA